MKVDAMDAGGDAGMEGRPRVLIAGIGNVLRRDDGFGPAVAAALERQMDALPAGTRVIEVGIGGMGLIHELMDGYEALILVDAVGREGAPGTLYTLEPELPDLESLPPEERRILGSDMHELVPGRALVLAAALNVLPPRVRIIGCKPAETEELSIELSPRVAAVVPRAVERAVGLAWELAGPLPDTRPDGAADEPAGGERACA